MSEEPIGRKALRAALGDTRADAARLVADVPAMMREARRRKDSAALSPTLPQLASWALPRLAAATAVAVLVAVGVASRGRGTTPEKPATLESVIWGGNGDGTGDVVFDALLDVGRSDG